MRWRFGDFTFDVDTRRLSRDTDDVHLSPKAFELLALLISRKPNVVPKKDLIEHLWPGTFVVEANLSNVISEIRAALGDAERAAKFIRTVHRLGYAFDGDAIEESGIKDQGSGIRDQGAGIRERGSAVACWIEWGRHRFPLEQGEHVIGRDADADVKLDSTTVSRRHAGLIVSGDRTLLEDFGSHNGTYIRETRVTTPTPLHDGDIIRIGDVMLTYRVMSGGGSTVTYSLRAQ